MDTSLTIFDHLAFSQEQVDDHLTTFEAAQGEIEELIDDITAPLAQLLDSVGKITIQLPTFSHRGKEFYLNFITLNGGNRKLLGCIPVKDCLDDELRVDLSHPEDRFILNSAQGLRGKCWWGSRTVATKLKQYQTASPDLRASFAASVEDLAQQMVTFTDERSRKTSEGITAIRNLLEV